MRLHNLRNLLGHPRPEESNIFEALNFIVCTREFNLYAPRFLYIGQAFRYSPENALYIFNQQIYFII